MKRRGDHDTSAEGRPGENRGEAGTYGAEHHRPPDEIPHRERTDCSRQFRGVRGEIRDDHISDVSGRDSLSKGMLIIPPGFTYGAASAAAGLTVCCPAERLPMEHRFNKAGRRK